MTTNAEFEARARACYHFPLTTAYRALADLHDALESVARVDQAAQDLIADAELVGGGDFMDEVVERTGAGEFWDLLAAVQALGRTHTDSEVDESNLIPIGLVHERLAQLQGVDERTIAEEFDPPCPLEQRLDAIRAACDPMPAAGEATIARIVAALVEPGGGR